MDDLFSTTFAKPLLSGSVNYYRRNGELVADTPDESYVFTGDSANILTFVLPRLNGEKGIETLAEELEIDPKKIVAHLNALATDDLVLEVGRAARASASTDFIAAYFRECRFRSKEICAQPFWNMLLSGEAPIDLVIGWGVEFYHYVDGANEHMAASVAHCRHDPELRRWLADHYVEEHNHGAIFLLGLAACGLDPEQVKRASPLPSTRALINYLTELAASDTIAYTGAFGVMQAAGDKTTPSGISEVCDHLVACYPTATGLFEAVRKHALIDAELNHQNLVLERICSRDARIAPVIAPQTMRAVIDTVEHFILFFEGIHDYYRKPGIRIPRQALDIRTLL